jgi:hypothetical protein
MAINMMKVSLPSCTTILAVFMAFVLQSEVDAFVAPSMRAFLPKPATNHEVCRQASTITRSDKQDFLTNEETNDDGRVDADDELDIDFLFEDPEIPYENLDAMEKVWRYATKPLLRIGSKGATHSHGNSLRQLLDDHTVVKVKCNLKKFGRSIPSCLAIVCRQAKPVTLARQSDLAMSHILSFHIIIQELCKVHLNASVI